MNTSYVIQRTRRLMLIFLGVCLLFLSGTAELAGAQQIPMLRIVSAVPGESVTVETINFPPNLTFTVTIGPSGTQGIGGPVVGTTHSGAGGTFQETYPIPEALRNERWLTIRMQGPLGWFAFHWFENQPSFVPEQPPKPSFLITEVTGDHSVTIEATDFPPNQPFQVMMGLMDTEGVDGIVVDTTDTGATGNFTATYAIPEALHGQSQIAVRLQGPAPIFAHNWFFNATFASPVPAIAPLAPPAIFTGIPTFRIVQVIPGQSVTIETNNFPPNQDFRVTMGRLGTEGIGGVPVTTTPSGDGGTFRDTYTIPQELRHLNRLAIRLESPQGFFAFNWFINQ